VVVTVADRADPRSARYAEAIARHGGQPILVTGGDRAAERAAALGSMAGLLLAGGTDIDPARYGGRPGTGVDPDPARDELEAEAWAAAEERQLPILGICRGFQAINVFSGGKLLSDVGGHRGTSHPLRVAPGTRLARILFPTNSRGGVVEVNSSHHQGVRPADLAPGLVASGTSSSPAGELVEALETRAGRFVVGVQSHPERTESTPPAFERLFAVFVDASRGAATSR
jgi:gamma-glutamyl-gamma-aminobutyrate hydrolase PuuD